MFTPTRRRALALLVATGAGTRFLPGLTRARAQEVDDSEAVQDDNSEGPSEPDCFDSKKFGPWTAQATDLSAGATQSEVPPEDSKTCGIALEFQVDADFNARIFLEGSAEGTALPKELLRDTRSRLIVTAGDGAIVDEALCGNCTDIYDDTVTIVLPLATAPLLREQETVMLALDLTGTEAVCRFGLDCVTMRKALDWATARRETLATDRDDNACNSVEDCFITTACCEVLGLDDNCFELRSLRRYRDHVLTRTPGGPDAIARYYRLAPALLARLRADSNGFDHTMQVVYARYVMPSALAARLRLNGLAYRLYVRMLDELCATCGMDDVRRPRTAA
jgi:hypothetical protein